MNFLRVCLLIASLLLPFNTAQAAVAAHAATQVAPGACRVAASLLGMDGQADSCASKAPASHHALNCASHCAVPAIGALPTTIPPLVYEQAWQAREFSLPVEFHSPPLFRPPLSL